MCIRDRACYALSIVMVRLIDESVSNSLLYLYASFASAVAAIAIALLSGGFTPIASWLDAGLILIMSICGGIAVLLLMLAYRYAMPSLLAPFNFVSLITAFTFGYLIFGEAPFQTLFPGVLLIVLAAGLVMWRERSTSTQNIGVK